MRKLYTNIVFSVLFFPFFSAYAGEQLGGFDLSANVGFFNEYSFRGITQSDEEPSLQGGFDIAHESGLYVGFWGSNVDFNDGDEAHIEMDIYGGYSAAIDNFSYDVGFIYYAYPGVDGALNYDFWEGVVGIGYDFNTCSSSNLI